MKDRRLFMSIHALLAAFILPAVVMYIVTGALYTWGEKGSYNSEGYEIQLTQPLQADLGSLTALVKQELNKRELRAPEGKPKVKKYGSHFLLEWTGSSKDVILEPTDNALVASITIKETTWYRSLVQLHKAKGGTAFKVYAAFLAIALGLILVSGYVMALQTPPLKRATLVTTVLGIATFAIFALIS
ncbi:PepSY domain-containing protein [Puniceicoccaceae bacterium K14]|nr:PepSY domain-containing protein [Puniceicoccaceae bacterium K14]